MGSYKQLDCKNQYDINNKRRVGNIISELDMQGLINAKIVSLGRQGRTRYINLEMDKRQIESILEEDDFLRQVLDGMKESRYFNSMQLRLI